MVVVVFIRCLMVLAWAVWISMGSEVIGVGTGAGFFMEFFLVSVVNDFRNVCGAGFF